MNMWKFYFPNVVGSSWGKDGQGEEEETSGVMWSLRDSTKMSKEARSWEGGSGAASDSPGRGSSRVQVLVYCSLHPQGLATMAPQ